MALAWTAGCDYPDLRRRAEALEQENADLRELNATLTQQLTGARADVLRLEAELERQARGLSPMPGSAGTSPLEPRRSDLASSLAYAGVTVAIRKDRIVITMPAAFESGKAVLTAQGRTTLRRIAAAVKKHCPGWEVGVAGHSDSTPIGRRTRRRYPTNWHLSGFRALAAMDYLDRVCGIPARTLHFRGYGQHHPVASNTTAAGRARNRRIEIILAPPQ
ncbi:MAG: OmpA family protein [Planctomycetota bacterium]